MAGEMPFGIREAQIVPYNTDGSLGTAIPLPAINQLQVQVQSNVTEARGNDKVVASAETETISVTIQNAGIPVDALPTLRGGTLTTTGTGATLVRTYEKKGADRGKRFLLRGRAVDESGISGTRVEFPWCKATDGPAGTFQDGAFYVNSCTIRVDPHPTSDVLFRDIIEATSTTL